MMQNIRINNVLLQQIDTNPVSLKKINISKATLQSIDTNHVSLEKININYGQPIFVNGNTYKGDYTVSPRAHEEQTLPTKNKTLLDDVTILKIPYYQSSNDSGDTIYIASEV